MDESWHSPEVVIGIIVALIGYITALIALVYRNLAARLDKINGEICAHDGCLDDHEKRLIREEEKRKAHDEVCKGILQEISRLAKEVDAISRNCIAMHVKLEKDGKIDAK